MREARVRHVARKFSELRRKMAPESRKKSRETAAKYDAEMALDELREARQMTQEHLASLLGIKQPAIAKMERRTDMYLSTLQSIIKAMGGHLVVKAVFAEGSVEIKQLRDLHGEKQKFRREASSRSERRQVVRGQRKPIDGERRQRKKSTSEVA